MNHSHSGLRQSLLKGQSLFIGLFNGLLTVGYIFRIERRDIFR